MFLFLLVLVCMYPFYYIFIYSISIPAEAAKSAIYFLPKGFTLQNYSEIFKLNHLAFSAFISLSRTIVGTIVTVFCSSMFAYALSKPNLQFRKFIYRITISTMYINAGIIPWYITMKSLGLKDNFLLYVLPSAIVAFYLVLIKTYIEQIPDSMEESAMIDGANVITIFFRIILPLCIPVLAVVAIFAAVGQWNAWTDNFFLGQKLPTLQLVLLTFLTDQSSNTFAMKSNMSNVTVQQVTPTSIRMTVTMIVTLPIIFVYPFFQKYFISGIMVGAVKG
jgi:putative aldouronate transport system permease protein